MMDALTDRIVKSLAGLPGLAAVALGGSRARGSHHPGSDYDMALYYDAERPLDTAALDALASRLDDRRRSGLVTPLGGWGPWINGGGWLHVDGQAVDFLYCELNRIQAVITECAAGRFTVDDQPGHPLGFPSFIYAGAADLALPLWDPAGRLAQLKAQVRPYPPALKQAVFQRFFWEAGFSLRIARKGAAYADSFYTAGCLFRAGGCLLHCLFALNETYWLNEKAAAALAGAFAKKPQDLASRLQACFAALESRAGLDAAIADLESLVSETRALILAEGFSLPE